MSAADVPSIRDQ